MRKDYNGGIKAWWPSFVEMLTNWASIEVSSKLVKWGGSVQVESKENGARLENLASD